MKGNRGVAAMLLAFVTAGSVACSGPRAGDGPHGPRRCEVAFQVPDGFHVVESHRERYADRIGVRISFRDRHRREIHYFVGIPGEFGEGLPPDGRLDLADGSRAVLLGRDGVWVLAWDVAARCSPIAVLGSGFRRGGFVRVLQAAGVLPAA